MKYKWRIDIILCSGEKITGYFEGPQFESLAVGKLLFAGEEKNIISLSSKDRNTQIFC